MKQFARSVVQRELSARTQLNETSNICTHPEGIIQQPSHKTNISGTIEFKPSPDGRSVLWEVAQDRPELGSVSGLSMNVESQNYCKTRHEVVADYFSGGNKTDEPWSVIDSSISDNTTPDLIQEYAPGIWVIVEIGTTRGRPAKVYRDKFTKYMLTINRLSELHPDWTFLLWIVIVNFNEVMTSFQMNGSSINELITRYQIGNRMEEKLIEAGLFKPEVENMTQEERLVKASISRLGSAVMKGSDNTLNEFSGNEFREFVKDDSYLTTSVSLMAKQVSDNNISPEDAGSDMEEAFRKVEHAIEREGKTRSDKKSPVQMPLFLADESPDEMILRNMHINRSGLLPDHIDHVWREAYDSKIRNTEGFHQMSIEDEVTIAKGSGFSEVPDKGRSQWHRVEIDLGKYEEVFALDGLHGKKFKNADFKDQRREFQSKGFSFLTETDDIDECINLKPAQCTENNLFFRSTLPLLEKANTMIGNTPEGLETIRQLYNTDVMISLSQLSAIASELAVSLRQHVKHNAWIVKKIKGYEIELLVKPTNSESHVFFMMRMRGRVIEQGTFRRLYHFDGWFYTDLLSVNSSRLENMVRAPVIYVTSLIHFRINIDRMDKDDLHYNSQTGFSERAAMLTLLLALEDKSSTEEMALNTRYIIMQFMKGPDPLSPPNPGPAIQKTPTVLRSRLAVYIYNRIKQYCFLQMANLPVRVLLDSADADHSADQFDGLICPFTHCHLSTFADVVQIMYIAYAKNKDAAAEQNCDFGMIKKIVEYGLNTDQSRMSYYDGSKDPPKGEVPRPHEFSPSFLADAVELIIQRFKSDLGHSWQSQIEATIVKELIRSTHHESLATMKASANFDIANAKIMVQIEEREKENFNNFSADQVALMKRLLESYKRYGRQGASKEQWAELNALIEMGNLRNLKDLGKGRFKRIAKSCKCHEAVIQELKSDVSLVPLLIGDYHSIFSAVMGSMGGICCYLFKKNQHGGLREIYVLTFKSRLLQLLPEVTARILCGLCPEEVLTHPDKKTTGYEIHHANVTAATGKGMSSDVIHRTSSEDKSKWSQGMNVTAFAFVFSRILPASLSEALNRVFYAFRNKKVLLPEGVVNLLTNDTRLDDDTYEKLREIFHSNSKHDVFENIKGFMFLKTPTGMWQGILHYCSSFLHVLQTVHYKAVCRSHFKKMNDERRINQEEELGTLVLDTVVSSDDSATYGSVVLPQGYSGRTASQANALLDFILKLQTYHSSFFMMTESPKSCISSRTVGEFNSIFSCSKTYISPAIKKVLAAATIPETEDIEGRQVVLANLMKDILEEGCSHYQVHLTELACSFLHYSAFGLTTSRLFEVWTELIVQNPDPHLGFLLLDLQETAGVFGYDFKKYISLKNTEVAIMPNSPAVLQLGLEGSHSTGVVLTQGDRRRWKQFADRVVTKGWKEYLEHRPEVLYMEHGTTREEIEARLSSKACSKGVHESLKQGNSMVRVLATTVYLLSRNVMTVTKLDLNEEGVSKETDQHTEKKSLMNLTAGTDGALGTIPHSKMTDEQRSLLYPNYILHQAVADSAMASRFRELLRTVRYRKTRNKIEVRSSANLLVLPLLAVLRIKWMGGKKKYASAVIEHSWDHYRKIFPWIMSGLHETLEASPFTTHLRMHSFFQSVDKKASRLAVLARKVRSFNPYDQIMELINHNFYPELRRAPITKADRDCDEGCQKLSAMITVKAATIQSVATALIHGPVTGDVTELMSTVLEGVELGDEDVMKLSKTRAGGRASVLYAVVNGLNSAITTRALLNSGQGVIKTYVEPQELENGKWVNGGRLIISTKRINVEVLVHDSHVIAMKVKNIPALRDEYQVIAEYLQSDGFDWDPDKSIGSYSGKFPEIGTNKVTDWTCSAQGLIRMPLDGKTVRDKRGIIKYIEKINITSLNFPVIIQSADVASETLEGPLWIEKCQERNGQPSLRIMNNCDNRDVILMKIYGGKKPRISDSSSAQLLQEVDDESLLSTWMSGGSITARVGLQLLKYANDEENMLDEDIALEHCDKNMAKWFIKQSFKWRAINKSKIQIDSYRFIDDVVAVESEVFVTNQSLRDQANELAASYVAMLETEETGPRAEIAEDAGLIITSAMSWNDEMEMQDAKDKVQAGANHGQDGENEEEGSDTTTEALTINEDNFKATPGLFMSHPLWDKLIERLEEAKIWVSIREDILLTGNPGLITNTVCDVLDLKRPNQKEIDFDEE